ncbi:MAG: class B sortase [Defluviitaleaceae bacterium]|nr:class B sortase [Defluviitaleaceae bacterium]
MTKRKPIASSNALLDDEYQDEKQRKWFAAKRKTRGGSKSPLFIFVCCLALVTVITVIVSAAIVFTYINDLNEMRRQHASLLDLAEEVAPSISEFDIRMRLINPDYICWIRIEGTDIDYPVVRGADNYKYLDTSFYGEENQFGTLFMDYRCVGEYVPHIIIYGHNTRYGDMFSELHKFLDARFLAEHSIITVKVNDRIVEYEIFSARKTDVSDPAYHLDFSAPGSFRAFAERTGAPSDAKQIITLSTCVSGDNADERVVVQGAFFDL